MLFVFDEESILLMVSVEVQALWAGVVGVSPLPNVLVNRRIEVGFLCLSILHNRLWLIWKCVFSKPG